MIDKGADICRLPTTQYAAKALLQRMEKKEAKALRIQEELSDCCALNERTCTKSLLGLTKHRLTKHAGFEVTQGVVPISQPFDKVIRAFSLIIHLSLLGPNALLDRCEHLSLRTQVQKILEVQIPQELGFSTLGERTGGEWWSVTREKGTRNSDGKLWGSSAG